MKAVEFAEHLSKSAQVLNAAQADAPAASLNELAQLFRVQPNSKVADVVAKLMAEPMPAGAPQKQKVDAIEAVVLPLKDFIEVSASKAIAADYTLLAGLLKTHRDVPFDTFLAVSREALSRAPATKAKQAKLAKKVRTDLVELYNRRLEEALGDDDGFRQIYAQLERDPEMASPELTALAKRFALASPRNRDQALRKVFSRHQALMIGRAASRATAGRIAG